MSAKGEGLGWRGKMFLLGTAEPLRSVLMIDLEDADADGANDGDDGGRC